MSQLRKSSRLHSARHLSDDYAWDSLSPLLPGRREDSPTFHQNAKTQIAPSTSGLPLSADQPGRQKLSQAEILEQSERVLPSVVLPPSATAGSPHQSSREDRRKLRIHMETQELEIKRLQLELQLAQLKLASNTSPKPDDSAKTGDKSSEKSLGDQRAPQRITNPQDWPHIFAPDNSTVTVYGRGFDKFNSFESHSVWCGFKFYNIHRQVTKASLVEENRLVCPLPVLNDTESVLMLQVSLNNGKTFISSNVNISAKNCVSGAENKTENGTKTGMETGKAEQKPESGKGKAKGTSGIKIPIGLLVALLALFAFLILFVLWWFWPRFSRKPPRNCEPDSAPEPRELAPNPPPAVQKTASGKAKWPTVDVSYYGGRSAGGIVPVRVDWGDKKSTEAGARLNGATPSQIKDSVEPENSTGVSSSSLTLGCWTAVKTKLMAGYRRLASHRPQRGGHWLYSSNPTV